MMTATDNDDAVQALAQEILNDATTDENGVRTFIDPLTLIMILSAIIQGIYYLIQTWKTCKQKPADAVQLFKKPSRLTRVRLRLAYRNALPDDLRQYEKALVASTIKVCGTRSESDTVRLFEFAEARGQG